MIRCRLFCKYILSSFPNNWRWWWVSTFFSFFGYLLFEWRGSYTCYSICFCLCIPPVSLLQAGPSKLYLPLVVFGSWSVAKDLACHLPRPSLSNHPKPKEFNLLNTAPLSSLPIPAIWDVSIFPQPILYFSLAYPVSWPHPHFLKAQSSHLLFFPLLLTDLQRCRDFSKTSTSWGKAAREAWRRRQKSVVGKEVALYR